MEMASSENESERSLAAGNMQQQRIARATHSIAGFRMNETGAKAEREGAKNLLLK